MCKHYLIEGQRITNKTKAGLSPSIVPYTVQIEPINSKYDDVKDALLNMCYRADGWEYLKRYLNMKKKYLITIIVQFLLLTVTLGQTDSININFKQNTNDLKEIIRREKADSIMKLRAQNNYRYTQRYDTLRFETLEITEMDSVLIKMLKYHQKNTEKGMKKKYQKHKVYCIEIFPYLKQNEGIPQSIIDSIFSNNQHHFPIINPFTPSYLIVISTSDKRNEYSRTVRNAKYYYNYKGNDVFICSDLKIEFPHNNQHKSFVYCLDNDYKYDEYFFMTRFFYDYITHYVLCWKSLE